MIIYAAIFSDGVIPFRSPDRKFFDDLRTDWEESANEDWWKRSIEPTILLKIKLK
jgi:hypothetical protein